MPSLWPHIWAIPMMLMIGFFAGWMARSSLPTGPGARHERKYDDDD